MLAMGFSCVVPLQNPSMPLSTEDINARFLTSSWITSHADAMLFLDGKHTVFAAGAGMVGSILAVDRLVYLGKLAEMAGDSSDLWPAAGQYTEAIHSQVCRWVLVAGAYLRSSTGGLQVALMAPGPLLTTNPYVVVDLEDIYGGDCSGLQEQQRQVIAEAFCLFGVWVYACTVALNLAAARLLAAGSSQLWLYACCATGSTVAATSFNGIRMQQHWSCTCSMALFSPLMLPVAANSSSRVRPCT